MLCISFEIEVITDYFSVQSEFVSIDGYVACYFKYELTERIADYNEILTEFPLVQGKIEARAVGKSLLVLHNRGNFINLKSIYQFLKAIALQYSF